jgi:methionyl-tRNA formyltransferase
VLFEKGEERGEMSGTIRLLFMGTPQFACPILKRIVEEKEYTMIGVFTQADRPKGRGKMVQPPPVKLLANSLSIPVFQPLTLKEGQIEEELSALKPDVVVVVAYGHILPSWILRSPGFGCINLHASLLPLYRGAAPVNWALINGEQETGVTTMLMDEGMDTGPILLQERTPIHPQDTAESLLERLSVRGAELMIKTLRDYREKRIFPQKQPGSGATMAPKLDKEIGRLDWGRDTNSLWNLIRGVTPFPGAFTFLDGQMIKILKAVPIAEGVMNRPPGMICGFDLTTGLIVQTGTGMLGVHEVHPANKKRMDMQAFLNGLKINPIGKSFRRFPDAMSFE